MPLFGPNIEMMERLGDVEGLIGALKHKDAKVRFEAGLALGRIGDARAIKLIIQGLKDGNSEFIVGAGHALNEIGEPAFEPLIDALKDEDVNVRRGATAALGSMGDFRMNKQGLGVERASVVEPLINALKDEDAGVRGYVANALGHKGDARAVEPLTQALKDEDKAVQIAAKVALELIEKFNLYQRA